LEDEMPQYIITHGDRIHEAEVRRIDGHLFEVLLDGQRYEVDACAAEDSVMSLLVDGDNYEVHYSRDRDRYTLLIGAEHYEVQARNRRVRSAFTTGGGLLSGRQVVGAPMPGRVVSVLVEPGQEVAAGDPLLTLEAMKMENQLRSPVAGTVHEVAAEPGQVVATGDKLLVVG
jgi:biotin carboxyl carrier protein